MYIFKPPSVFLEFALKHQASITIRNEANFAVLYWLVSAVFVCLGESSVVMVLGGFISVLDSLSIIDFVKTNNVLHLLCPVYFCECY